MAKVSYAGKFKIVVQGREDLPQEEIRDLMIRQMLRYGNKNNAFGDCEVTHYKGKKL